MPRKTPFSLKRLYGNIIAWLTTSAGAEVAALGESGGQLGVSAYGTASGGTVTALKVEGTTGELDVVLHGKDAAGPNIDPLRTNASQQLQVEVVDGGQAVQVDPQSITASETDLWDPGTTASDLYEVYFLVVNVDGTNAVTVSIGVDIGDAGSLADPEYWMKDEVVPAPGSSGWRGPFHIPGDDPVMGVAGAADDAAIHFRVRKIQ